MITNLQGNVVTQSVLGGPAICPQLLIKFPVVYTCRKLWKSSVAVLGKNIWGAWPLIIWEATAAKRNYYRTNNVLPKI